MAGQQKELKDIIPAEVLKTVFALNNPPDVSGNCKYGVDIITRALNKDIYIGPDVFNLFPVPTHSFDSHIFYDEGLARYRRVMGTLDSFLYMNFLDRKKNIPTQLINNVCRSYIATCTTINHIRIRDLQVPKKLLNTAFDVTALTSTSDNEYAIKAFTEKVLPYILKQDIKIPDNFFMAVAHATMPKTDGAALLADLFDTIEPTPHENSWAAMPYNDIILAIAKEYLNPIPPGYGSGGETIKYNKSYFNDYSDITTRISRKYFNLIDFEKAFKQLRYYQGYW